MDINILFEDQHIIVCEKPVGVPSQSDKTSDYDMINRLKNYIFEKEANGKQPYIGIVHRLDRPVGGIMVFAKTAFALKQLNNQITSHKVEKKYYAVVTKDLSDKKNDTITLIDYLEKDGRTNLSKVVNQNNKNSKKAELKFKVLDTIEDTVSGLDYKLSLIEVDLITGRHHQIRVQMAHAGACLWGDTKYNEKFKDKKGWHQIALFAHSLSFEHPKSGKKMSFDLNPKSEPFLQFPIFKE